MKCPRLRYLVPLLASLTLMLGADAIALYATSPPDRYGVDQRIAAITYAAACRLSQYTYCPEIGPTVRRSPILGEMASARGAYWMGAPVVWLDTTVGGTQAWLTILHEQIHYLQWHNEVDSEGFDRTLTCLLEREALEFTNAYARELRRPKLIRTVEDWRDLYNCHEKNNKRIMGIHDVRPAL